MLICAWELTTCLWFSVSIIITKNTLVITTSNLFQVLSHCERITDVGINHLVSNACGDKLQVLELDNCPLITDDSLDKLR